MKWELAISMIMLVLLGCDSAGEHSGPEWWGEAQAKRNGEVWKMVPIAHELQYRTRTPAAVDSFYFRIATYSEAGWMQEHLSFGYLPKRAGKISLERLNHENAFGPSLLYTLLDGGDGVLADYGPDEASENWIMIDRYDPNTKELEGRFELTLILEFSADEGFADTVRFENGSFRTVIVEKEIARRLRQNSPSSESPD